MSFYERTIKQLMAAGHLKHHDRVLAVCAGQYDAEVLRRCGLAPTISNLADRWDAADDWIRQDAEDMTLQNEAYDWVIVHAGLHHCASPHRALLEMYRVARKGVLVIEARDSALMRLAIRLGVTPEFEHVAVELEGGLSGGWRNTAIPNFIYRWTEREVRKTIESARPDLVHRLDFFYGLEFPDVRIGMTWMRYIAPLLRLIASAIHALFPKQGNKFAFAILKTGEFKPWLRKRIGDVERPDSLRA